MGRSEQPSESRFRWWFLALIISALLLGIVLTVQAPDLPVTPISDAESQESTEGLQASKSTPRKAPDSSSTKLVASTTPLDETDKLDETDEYVSGSTTKHLDEQARALDPTEDGWDTEVTSAATNARYKLLAKWLAKPKGPSKAQLTDFLADDFQCAALLPTQMSTTYSEGALQVVRAANDAREPELYRGVDGFSEAVAKLLDPLQSEQPRHVKFKQFKIDKSADQTRTTAYFHAFANTADGPVEINSTWNCWWDTQQSELKLARVEVEEFEQTSAEIDSPTLFADCTEAVLGDSPSFRERLLYDVSTWRQRLPANLNLQYHGHIGLAVGDVNGDGLEDVYLCQPGGLPNSLYLHQPDGTVREVSAEAGVDVLNYTRGALFVDLDNDGDQDLILTVIDQLMFYANDGNGKFAAKAELPFVRGAYSISAADYDGDRDLDVYVCRHRADGHEKGEFPVPYPYYEANNGGQNYFLRNDGDWQFTDATAEVGLDADNSRFSFASSWEDFDNDGDLDLYVANDFGHNTLYRNDDGKFVSVAEEIGLEDAAFGMSVSWGDYNRDGLMDLYVGNMFSAAGNRITFQERFRPESQEESRKKYQRTARGNSLFKNQGDGTFLDVSTQAGVTQGRWSWASLFADINNDGWEDLIVTNGFVTGDTIDDL